MLKAIFSGEPATQLETRSAILFFLIHSPRVDKFTLSHMQSDGHQAAAHGRMCHAGIGMRDPQIIDTELMEISAIADDTTKFERIIAWCAAHPDEVPFVLHQFLGRSDKHPSQDSETS